MKSLSGTDSRPASSQDNHFTNEPRLSKTSIRYWLKVLRGNSNESQRLERSGIEQLSMRNTGLQQISRLSDLRVNGPFGTRTRVSAEDYIQKICTTAKRKNIEAFAKTVGQNNATELLNMALGNSQPKLNILKNIYAGSDTQIINAFLSEQLGIFILSSADISPNAIASGFADSLHRMDKLEYFINLAQFSIVPGIDYNQIHDQIISACLDKISTSDTDYSTKYENLTKTQNFFSNFSLPVTPETEVRFAKQITEANSKSYIESSFSIEFLKYLDKQGPHHYSAAMNLLKSPSLDAIPIETMQQTLKTLTLNQLLYLCSAYSSGIKTQLECFSYQEAEFNQAKLFNLINAAFKENLGGNSDSIRGHATNIRFIQNLKSILIQRNQMLTLKVFEKQYFSQLITTQASTIPASIFSRVNGRWSKTLALQGINIKLKSNQAIMSGIWGIDEHAPALENAKAQAKDRLATTIQTDFEKALAKQQSNTENANTDHTAAAVLNSLTGLLGDGSRNPQTLAFEVKTKAQHHKEYWNQLQQRYSAAVKQMPEKVNNEFEQEGKARALKLEELLIALSQYTRNNLAQFATDDIDMNTLLDFQLTKALDVIETQLENIEFDSVQTLEPNVDNLIGIMDAINNENGWDNTALESVIDPLIHRLADQILIARNSNYEKVSQNLSNMHQDLKDTGKLDAESSKELSIQLNHYANTVYQLKNLQNRINDPQLRIDRLILPLADAVKMLKTPSKGTLAVAVQNELLATLNDLKSKIPQQVLTTALIIANAENNSVESEVFTSLLQVLKPDTSVHPEQIIKLYEHFIEIESDKKFEPLVMLIKESLKCKYTRPASLKQLQRKAEDRNPQLRPANELLDDFKNIFQTDSTSSSIKEDLFKQYKMLVEQSALTTTPWIQHKLHVILSSCRKQMIPPENAESLKSWKERYEALLPLMSAAQVSPVDFAPLDVQKSKGVNMKYLYTDQDVESLLSFKVNYDLSQEADSQENPVTIALSASDQKELKSRILDWLKANNPEPDSNTNPSQKNSSMEALLVIPFCPVDEKGESTNHWSGIVISQSTSGQLQAGYIDTLDAASALPANAKSAINDAVALLSLDHKNSKVQFKTENELRIKHSQQRDITSCGSLLAHDMQIVIEKWQKSKVIPTSINTTKSAFEIRQNQIQEFGGMTSEFATRQMWNIYFNDTLNRQDFFTQDRLITSIVKSMNSMPQARLNSFMRGFAAAEIAPYLDFYTRRTLFREKLVLKPMQIINRSYDIFTQVKAIKNSMAAFRQHNFSLLIDFEKILKPIINTDDDKFDAAQAVKQIREFLIKNQDKLGDSEQKEAILQGFFPKYDANKSQDLSQLDLCPMEAVRIQKQINSMLYF